MVDSHTTRTLNMGDRGFIQFPPGPKTLHVPLQTPTYLLFFNNEKGKWGRQAFHLTGVSFNKMQFGMLYSTELSKMSCLSNTGVVGLILHSLLASILDRSGLHHFPPHIP